MPFVVIGILTLLVSELESFVILDFFVDPLPLLVALPNAVLALFVPLCSFISVAVLVYPAPNTSYWQLFLVLNRCAQHHIGVGYDEMRDQKKERAVSNVTCPWKCCAYTMCLLRIRCLSLCQ